MLRETVDLEKLLKALPNVDTGKTWNIAEENVHDMGIVVDAANKILKGDLMVVRDAGELGMEFLVIPVSEGISLEPGYYRLVPLDAKSVQGFEENLDGSLRSRASDYDDGPYPGAHAPDQPIGEKEKILQRVFRNWDFSGSLPRPVMQTLRCFCGNTEWHPRYWLFHDYKMQQSDNPHRFRFRCDVSMKCVECGYVGVWGVVVPDEWWYENDIYPRKVTWQEAAGMLKSDSDGQSNDD